MLRTRLIISQQYRNYLPYKILRRTNTSQNEKNKKLKYTNVSVDRSGLLGFGNKYKSNEENNSDATFIKESLSPLAKDLLSYIELRGPITVHDYMSQCLNHLIHGYYQQKKEKELIGNQGDFITSPEITQLFGELIGIWCISMWKSMNQPQKINLVELGPGNGTLMKDILRVIEKFPVFKNVVNIHLVELSQALRVKQYNQFNSDVTKKTIIDSHCYQTKTGINIHWYSFLNQVPSDVPVLIIGQEFLDAFPVHQFTYTEKGWREKLVDINRAVNKKQSSSKVTTNTVKDIDSIMKNINSIQQEKVQSEETLDNTYHFRFVISPTETPAVKSLLNNSNSNIISQRNTMNQTTTSISEAQGNVVNVGDSLEISPLAIAICEDIATRVVKSGGAALLIDYGESFTQEDSIRAFKNHKQIHVLSQPGIADLTADVDFSLCRKASMNKGAMVSDIITQGEFLMQMGILSRIEQLIELEETTDEEANQLVSSFKYLVEPQHMGKKFKVMAIVDPTIHSITGFSFKNEANEAII